MGYRWGAFLGLQGILAAEGRTTELRTLVDSAVARGLDIAPQLYLLDGLAGVDVEAEASAEATRLERSGFANASSFTLWLLGTWHARRGQRNETERMRSALEARAESARDARAARFADALAARLVLMGGDTSGAISRLRAVLRFGRREQLDWDLGESLASDRLLLAELLLAQGDAGRAGAAAGVFDHQAPAAFLPFLPASLTLRSRASVLEGKEGQARRFQDRLVALGQGGDPTREPSPRPKRRHHE
jgi:hypothetical protein